VIVEGLDLAAVGAGQYQLMCLPLRVMGGDGGPARAFLVRE
jgi:arylformamidase